MRLIEYGVKNAEIAKAQRTLSIIKKTTKSLCELRASASFAFNL